MVGLLADFLIDLIRFGGDDEQCLFLVALVQKMQNLRGGKLKNDGVQRFVPSEQVSRNHKNNAVPGKDIIPGFDAEFFGEKDGDKIGAAAGGVSIEAQIDGAGIKDAAEYSYEQNVICHLETGENICEYTGQNDHQTGISGEFFPDIFETDEDRYGIQREIDQGIGEIYIPEMPCDLLD